MQHLDDPVNQTIRERIKNIRQEKRLSVRKAAMLSEIPESSYSCMENDFYRISLLNLKKILDGLDASIDDVWPDSNSAEGAQSRPDLVRRVDPQTQRFFRLQEVFRLSDAKRAALLEGREQFQLAYSINLTEREQAVFLDYFPQRLHRSWAVFEKENRGFRCCLCLQDARLEGTLHRLVDIYLDLWLAEKLTEFQAG